MKKKSNGISESSTTFMSNEATNENLLQNGFPNIEKNIKAMQHALDFQKLSGDMMQHIMRLKYTYNFTWMGLPAIQLPQDLIAMQEIIWRVRPDLIIETGVAYGGSLVFYASMLELLGEDGLALGVEIDLRKHNRDMIFEHPMSKRIKIIEGSSIDPVVVEQVCALAKDKKRVLVCLDSNHTHDHVLKELNLYAPLVSKESYIVVFDTIIESMADNTFPARPWGKGNNPKTALSCFLQNNDSFEIDEKVDSRLILSVSPSGYLKRIR